MPNCNNCCWFHRFGVILLFASLLGCQSYHLEGIVIEGSSPGIWAIDQDDPKMHQNGLPNAKVQITLDPDSMQPLPQEVVKSDGAGRFAVPINAYGAGFLEYQMLLVVQREGYQTTTQILPLPGSNQRLLVQMAPGKNTYRQPQDVLQETLQIGRTLEQK